MTLTPALPVAVVTGAAGGIGRAVVTTLADAGHRVMALDGRSAEVDGAQRNLTVDVTDSVAVAAAVAQIEDEIGPIEVLVNGAGVLTTAPSLETTAEQWAHVFAVNTTAVFTVSTAVARRMLPRRRGSIVTIASNAGRVPRQGMAAYGASKAAAASFTQSLGLELAGHGIRCNVVSPGSTRTPMVTELLQRNESDERALIDGNPAAYKLGIPLDRIADPQDVADAVAYLVGDRARHVTMHDLVVDGGATLGR